jgi:hypothetical protein
MTVETVRLWCAGCRAERDFEQPPCIDGHGRDCPELACTHCGEALLGSATFGRTASTANRRTRREGRERRAS